MSKRLPPAPSLPRKLVAMDEDRGVVQPLCLQQWHHGVCGHHALYSASCILRGQPEALLDERRFWASTLLGVAALADHGEGSGKWPRSRVTGGVADETHLQHLADADAFLKDRVSIFFAHDGLAADLSHSDSQSATALRAVRNGQRRAHAFLCGATSHWYAVIAVGPAPGECGRPQLWLCDSYNAPVAGLRSDADTEAFIDRHMTTIRPRVYESLRALPEYAHRPEEHLAGAFETGVQEWWKGIIKAPLFWRHRPLSLRRELKSQEIREVRSYLSSLASHLGLPEE